MAPAGGQIEKEGPAAQLAADPRVRWRLGGGSEQLGDNRFAEELLQLRPAIFQGRNLLDGQHGLLLLDPVVELGVIGLDAEQFRLDGFDVLVESDYLLEELLGLGVEGDGAGGGDEVAVVVVLFHAHFDDLDLVAVDLLVVVAAVELDFRRVLAEAGVGQAVGGVAGVVKADLADAIGADFGEGVEDSLPLLVDAAKPFAYFVLLFGQHGLAGELHEVDERARIGIAHQLLDVAGGGHDAGAGAADSEAEFLGGG